MPSYGEWATEKARIIGEENRMVYFANGHESEDDLRLIIKTFQQNELARHVIFVHFTSDAGLEYVKKFQNAVAAAAEDYPEFYIEDVVAILLVDQNPEAEIIKTGQTPVKGETATEMLSPATPDMEAKVVMVPTDMLTPKGVLWTCERFKLRTNDFVMGMPGPNCELLERLMGVRLMPTKTLVC